MARSSSWKMSFGNSARNSINSAARLTSEERLHTVLAASKQVGTPMFFGVLIIAIVYLPILALSGIEGKMFHPMALTVMLALGGSLVLALTLMPALCSFLLRGKIAEGDNCIIRFVKSVYSPILRLALRLRWLVVVGALRASSRSRLSSSLASARTLFPSSMKARSP